MSSDDFQVPESLVKLYRHWSQSEVKHKPGDPTILLSNIDGARLEEITVFAQKRMQAWSNRQKQIHPTSKDSIIATFKFCNIYRELDRQTITFHTKLNDYRGDFEFWLLNMFAFRFLANIDTIERVGFLVPGKKNEAYLANLLSCPRPKFGNAYVFPISTIQNSPWPNREDFISLYVPGVIRDVSKLILSKKGRSVNELLSVILPAFGFNHRFLWTEVLIDVHYQFPEFVNLNRDFHIGPGAKPSLDYLKLSSSKASEQDVLEELAGTYSILDKVNLTVLGSPLALSAENWEGICCEFRKYQNLKIGKGRRRLYKNR